MCRMASFVLTKDKVYWSKKSDSHEDIISEYHLNDGENISILRAEIVPPNDNYRLPLEKWEYNIDQDIIPDWYVAPHEEERTRRTLADWVAYKIIIVGHREMTDGNYILYSSASAELYDSASAKLYGSASAELYGSASAELHGSASAKLHGSASAELYGSASAELYDSASAKLYGSASAELYGSASAMKYGDCDVSVADLAICIDRSERDTIKIISDGNKTTEVGYNK